MDSLNIANRLEVLVLPKNKRLLFSPNTIKTLLYSVGLLLSSKFS